MRSALCAAAAAIWVLAAAVQGQAEGERAAPDATITFRGRTASAGVGFAWGSSTVEFQGKTYPVRVDGFVLGAVGIASIEGTGQIYGLTKIEDLNGNYTSLASGAPSVGVRGRPSCATTRACAS